ALDFYTRLGTESWTDDRGRRRQGYVYKDPRDSFRKWERGEIGMIFAYVDEKLFSTVNPDLTGLAPVPLGPTGLRGGELNSRMMGLFSDIRYPAVRDAAWEYIRFYDSREALAIKTRVLVEGGLGQFVNPRYLEMFGYGELVRLSPPGWAETFDIAIQTGRPEPYGRHSNIAYDLMTAPLQQAEQMALHGELPTEQGPRLERLSGLLKKAADRARSEMLDEVTPARRALQRMTAAGLLLLIGVVFARVFRRIIRTFTPPGTTGMARPAGWAFRRYAGAYFMLLPALAAILVWRYVPLGRGTIMAFQDYRLLGASTWVGLDNFGRILWSVEWWLSLWNALRYSALVMALTFLPPVILAILLQEVPRGKVLFRLIYYLPAVMTGLVVVLLWKSFYEPGERGVLNALLMRIPALGFLLVGLALLLVGFTFARRLWFHERTGIAFLFLAGGGILCFLCVRLAWPMLCETGAPVWKRLLLAPSEPRRWLGDTRTAMPACVIPMLWAGLGPGSLIYLAALKSIPDELYEAADMDGATFTDKVLFVVFPMLKPLLIINFVGVFIGSWYGSADTILAMTGGAAGTEVAGLHIFYKAFIFLQFGPATAMAWMLGLLLIGFTVYQLRILSRIEFRAAGGTEVAK
ncbi:MAG: ABC transporter permease subunit, partial [Verrucomicrobia bacterium]|nr:ABC transporter permease subunit [Verrucomicrobiota bacterium]